MNWRDELKSAVRATLACLFVLAIVCAGAAIAIDIARQERLQAQEPLWKRIYYIKDERNGLCFALINSPIGSQTATSLTAVPCWAAEKVWHPEIPLERERGK